VKIYGDITRIFMIGIGGSGMSGMAKILNNIGYKVRGSDLNTESDAANYLKSIGIDLVKGHKAENLIDEQVVVYSSAIKFNNPELLEARRRGLLILRRAEMLSELMRLKFGIAVSGSHGKTTTTSMLGQILEYSLFDPTIVVGGKVKNFKTSAKIGKGEIMLVEADESDGSFLNFFPAVSIITNIDKEHLDHYGDFDTLKQAFLKFANSTPFYGTAIVCYDDEVIRELIPNINRVVRTYGLLKGADLRGEILDDRKSEFRVYCNEKPLGKIKMGVIGEHNIKNALASIAVALYLKKIPFNKIKEALESFEGVSRRFDIRYKGKVDIVEDYGHHPTEIKATSEIAKLYDAKRVIMVFQPHRYSRTKLLLKDFPTAFKGIDYLILTDIYPASETPIEGVDGELLYKEFINRGFTNIKYIKNLEDIVAYILKIKKDGDLIIFQGAGNIRNLIPEIIGRLKDE
jgi:UDP-N-acetylmuramate--alanine ligase